MRMIGGRVLPELHYFYSMTRAHVRAGSKAWHETILERGEEQILASGATNLGLTLPAQLATASFLQMVGLSSPHASKAREPS